jgi:glutaconate CoA-transferase subunit B
MEPEDITNEFIVTHLHQGVTRNQVRETIGWPVRFAATVETTVPPSGQELATLRDLQRRTALAHGTLDE